MPISKDEYKATMLKFLREVDDIENFPQKVAPGGHLHEAILSALKSLCHGRVNYSDIMDALNTFLTERAVEPQKVRHAVFSDDGEIIVVKGGHYV